MKIKDFTPISIISRDDGTYTEYAEVVLVKGIWGFTSREIKVIYRNSFSNTWRFLCDGTPVPYIYTEDVISCIAPKKEYEQKVNKCVE